MKNRVAGLNDKASVEELDARVKVLMEQDDDMAGVKKLLAGQQKEKTAVAV